MNSSSFIHSPILDNELMCTHFCCWVLHFSLIILAQASFTRLRMWNTHKRSRGKRPLHPKHAPYEATLAAATANLQGRCRSRSEGKYRHRAFCRNSTAVPDREKVADTDSLLHWIHGMLIANHQPCSNTRGLVYSAHKQHTTRVGLFWSIQSLYSPRAALLFSLEK